jgi:SAM-dependent methyltransferase
MFNNQPLHPDVAIANVDTLPFSSLCFDLVTASNLLFLLSDPVASLREMVRVVKPRGQIAILNPSEQMSVNAAAQLADKHNLEGLARDTLLNYAGRAERHNRWGKNEITSIFEVAGLRLVDIALKMGPGLVRFAKGMKE